MKERAIPSNCLASNIFDGENLDRRGTKLIVWVFLVRNLLIVVDKRWANTILIRIVIVYTPFLGVELWTSHSA
jgi:hypothetical protein